MTAQEIERFTKAERLYHWANAIAILFLLLTGALIWQDLDDWKLNGVKVIVQSHIWLGGGLLIGSALAFRLLRKGQVWNAAKRFNPGQRLNLRLFQLLLPFLTLSGIGLKVGKLAGVAKPTLRLVKKGHLIAAGITLLLVLGHVAMVLLVRQNRGILQGMRTGKLDRDVAARVAPQWLEAGHPASETVPSGSS